MVFYALVLSDKYSQIRQEKIWAYQNTRVDVIINVYILEYLDKNGIAQLVGAVKYTDCTSAEG